MSGYPQSLTQLGHLLLQAADDVPRCLLPPLVTVRLRPRRLPLCRRKLFRHQPTPGLHPPAVCLCWLQMYVHFLLESAEP